ncbi:hypothetical protein [Chryseobacterium sp. Leaf394]|uniref:hypothetical protein n=1 Tax=Chryseobacterium sp. Leaf394 TaxID=1736361 RepID=UPI0006F89A68|nr:hypothetical protein [Chryseobacterium sp. Leaf394]KQS91865.1 hypothetical protein ASG21_05230 [Chryseobacterium sp. Leaf394]
MEIRFTILFIFQILFFSAQLRNELKDIIEPIDHQYFKIILLENYDREGYSKLYDMFNEVSEKATNDELFYLALNGNTFVRVNSILELISRNDSRIIQLYRYYSKFPLEYKIMIGHVVSKQDMALSNIRGLFISQLKNYKWYLEMKNNIKNQKLTDFYSEDQIKYYENFDSKPIEDLISEFDKIDKQFIPQKLNYLEEIKNHWKDDKLQINYD